MLSTFPSWMAVAPSREILTLQGPRQQQGYPKAKPSGQRFQERRENKESLIQHQ